MEAAPTAKATNPTIFVDRDGVINEDSDAFIKSLKEWHPIPGSVEALATLSRHDYQIIVITNQSGIARGLFSIDDLTAMHNQLHQQVQAQGGTITDIFYCPHGPDDHCTCRKPLPGLFTQAQKKYNLDLKNSWYIGDSYRDLEAGQAAGTHVALVRTGKGSATLSNHAEELKNIPVFDNLQTFAMWLLANNKDIKKC
jgi:D-glycero-D-manno-heptose 1,7-bisphosphate phosphatase